MLVIAGHIAICVTFAAIAASDFRSRSISVLWLFLAGISALLLAFFIYGWERMLHNIITGGILLAFVNACCLIYFKAKYGRDSAYVNSAIGLGDIVFLAICIPLFNCDRFVWMMVASSAMGLLYALCFRSDSIPLAGISALVSMAIIIIEIFK